MNKNHEWTITEANRKFLHSRDPVHEVSSLAVGMMSHHHVARPEDEPRVSNKSVVWESVGVGLTVVHQVPKRVGKADSTHSPNRSRIPFPRRPQSWKSHRAQSSNSVFFNNYKHHRNFWLTP